MRHASFPLVNSLRLVGRRVSVILASKVRSWFEFPLDKEVDPFGAFLDPAKIHYYVRGSPLISAYVHKVYFRRSLYMKIVCLFLALTL